MSGTLDAQVHSRWASSPALRMILEARRIQAADGFGTVPNVTLLEARARARPCACAGR